MCQMLRQSLASCINAMCAVYWRSACRDVLVCGQLGQNIQALQLLKISRYSKHATISNIFISGYV